MAIIAPDPANPSAPTNPSSPPPAQIPGSPPGVAWGPAPRDPAPGPTAPVPATTLDAPAARPGSVPVTKEHPANAPTRETREHAHPVKPDTAKEGRER